MLNGSIIQRNFEKAAENEDPDDCVAYVRSVRVYCEDLFRIMLRKEAYEISGDSLGKFRERLATLRSDHVAPYTQSPFGNLLKQLDRNNAVIKILEQPHHEDDGTIDFATAQRVRAYWNNKLAAAFSNAFQLAVDHDAYGGDPRIYSWTETTASFPPSQAERLKTISFLHTGVVVAAATDGRIGDGLITLLDLQGDDAKTILHNHDAYRVTARTLTPVADVGDVVLVRNFGPPTARNLVVAPYGDALLARRLNDADAHPDLYILTGQATDPYALPEAVIALKSQLEPRKIVGTVFLGDVNSPPAGSTNEVEPLEDLSLLEAHLKDAHLLRVQGHSMEPVALDGQFVIIRRETCDVGTILKLDGRLVIAIDDSGGTYFKRFRPKRDIAILESVSSDGATSSEVLSLRPDGNYPVLTELFAVLGVLFEI